MKNDVLSERATQEKTIMQVNTYCTGCALCEAMCPQSAIHMELNKDGFHVPKIDFDMCVLCGRCLKSCPSRTLYSYNPLCAYYGWSESKSILSESSSGGAFTAIADFVLSKGGVVFGAAYDEDCYNVAFYSTDEVPLSKLKKSKYVESSASGIYKQIEECLNKGRLVLVSGTPCQCAGIREYFKDNHANLIICDFVCGGVPSLKYYQEHIKHLEKKYNSKAVYVDFRPKEKGWGRYYLLVKFMNGHRYFKVYFLDSYYTCFLNHSSTRESCETCKFSDVHRSDITIADFWGYGKAGVKKNKRGISLVICNTQKGLEVFGNTNGFEKHELDLKYAEYAITHRNVNTTIIEKKEALKALALQVGFEAAADSLFKTNIVKQYTDKILRLIKIQ